MPEPAAPPQHRLDVSLHDFLMGAAAKPAPYQPPTGLLLEDPPFPQRPDVYATREEDLNTPPYDTPPQRHWGARHVYRDLKGYLFPYVRSRVMPGNFHPIIAYLFTEWKCNLDCHYCWAYNNSVKGMTEPVARAALDWLADNGTGVLALMGGEPLLRPQFVHKVVYYATKRGMWVYLPTNGRLLRPEVIDQLGDAGVATVNLAVDSVEIKPSLPKALAPIRSYFEYLCKRQYRYGFTVFFNINICRNNLDDVRQLTEIAHDHGISTDYHINESPMTDHGDFKHLERNETYITRDDWPAVDATIDWIIDKNKSGYKMVDSVQRLEAMKRFMRGQQGPWKCRAGQNTLIVRVDGSLAPCFPLYSASRDWGTVGAHKFEKPQLDEMKKTCSLTCFSTLNHNVAMAYNDGRVIKFLLKQALHGFRGVTGSMDQS
ncbi:MAG: radical SAM protein [Acidobacteria bacterium]|nr:MAG: radical SAM protein [Acidobacteriota bacterium]